MSNKPTFREQVFQKMKEALGEPEVSRVRSGDLYRWPLTRPRDLNLYVTMDSPEREDLAHIMLSDGLKYQDDPIVDFTIYTLEEADKLIQRIVAQWRGETGEKASDSDPGR